MQGFLLSQFILIFALDSEAIQNHTDSQPFHGHLWEWRGFV